MKLSVLLVIVNCTAFSNAIKFICPVVPQWNQRASSICKQEVQYVCLLNTVNDTFTEACIGPIGESDGRIVFNINERLDVVNCPTDYYQPKDIFFNTTQGYNCLYAKSLCSEEGQLIHNNGSTTADRACRCDYSRGYAFISTNRTNPYYCMPSEEDCTCHIKDCLNVEKLSPDYQCVKRIDNEGQFNFSKGTGKDDEAAVINSQHLERRLDKCWPVVCDKNATCKEYEGQFICVCNFGFRGDGTACILYWNIHTSIIVAGFAFIIGLFMILSVNKKRIYMYYGRAICLHDSLTITPLEDVICICGENSTFACKVSTDTIPVMWYKEDKKIIPAKNNEDNILTNSRFVISSDNKAHFLTVKDVEESDCGKYSVVIGKTKRTANLFVRVPFLSPLKDVTCIHDEDVTFECEVSIENNNVKWYKDDEEITSNLKFTISSMNKMHFLKVTNVQENDNGKYCIDFRSKKSLAYLVVRAPFIHPPNNIICFLGEDATFKCEVGIESNQIKWYKEDREIDAPNSRFLMSSNNKVHQLMVKEVQENDSGEYVIHFRKHKRTANLIVRDKVRIEEIDYLEMEMDHVLHKTNEEHNYLKMKYLLDAVALPVVRKVFDEEFHPGKLQKTLQKGNNILCRLKKNKDINIAEFDLIFPKTVEYLVDMQLGNLQLFDAEGKESLDRLIKIGIELTRAIAKLYNKFEGVQDVKLVQIQPSSSVVTIRLICEKHSKDLNNLEQTLKSALDEGCLSEYKSCSDGFSFKLVGGTQVSSKDFDIRIMILLLKNLTDLNISDIPPSDSRTNRSADLSRVKFHRNKIFQNAEKRLTSEVFETDWRDLSQALIRLGGSEYTQLCDNIKKAYCQDYTGQSERKSLHEAAGLHEMLSDAFHSAVRCLFDQLIPPLKLKEEIEKNAKCIIKWIESKTIIQSQWDCFFPKAGNPSSEKLNVKSMMFLLKETKFVDQESPIFKCIKQLCNHLSKTELDVKDINQAINMIKEIKEYQVSK